MALLVQYDLTRNLLFTALAGAPGVFERLLDGLSDNEADIRPDPERFTIREAVAHVAAWELVFQERLRLTLREPGATMPAVAPAVSTPELASSVPLEQAALFRERRADTVALLENAAEGDWAKTAVRAGVGPLTLEAQAVMIALHDGYHAKQIADWRARYGPCCPG